MESAGTTAKLSSFQPVRTSITVVRLAVCAAAGAVPETAAIMHVIAYMIFDMPESPNG
jgi:hypothetical protein